MMTSREIHSSALFLCAFLIAIPTLALGQDDGRQGEEKPGWQRSHAIELGFYAGAYFPPLAHELYNLASDQKPMDRAAFIGGLRAGYYPLKFLGVEIEGGIMYAGLRDMDESALLYHVRGHVVGQYPWRLTPSCWLDTG